MPMIPDDFGAYRRFDEDLNASEMPDLHFKPLPISVDSIIRLRDTLFEPPLGERLCCTEKSINTNDTEKVKKIKKLVKKCTNLNVYIDGENIFKKILEICEGK